MFAGMFPASVFGSYEPTVMRFVAKAAMSADNDSLIAKSDTLGEITVMAAPVTVMTTTCCYIPPKSSVAMPQTALT